MVHVDFIGRLAADAETMVSKKGEKFITMRMGTDDYVNGNRTTCWVRVTCPPERYLNIAEYLKKGKPLHIHGTQRVSVYKNKNEEYVTSIDVMADRIDFIPFGNKENTEEKHETQTVKTEAPNVEEPSTTTVSVTSSASIDDLPF